MRFLLNIIFVFCMLVSYSQNRYELSLGAGQSFNQKVNLSTGTIGIKFARDRNLFIDFNRSILGNLNYAFGLRTTLNLASFLFELNQTIPYYSEKQHVPLFDFESLEITPYLKKSCVLVSTTTTRVISFLSVGLAFNINEGKYEQVVYSLRDDNPNRPFLLSEIQFSGQKPFVPYLRINGGIELHKKIGRQHYLGLSPFITWAGLQSEKNDLTVLPGDTAYISTGTFKRNRSGYGLRLIFSR